MKLVATCVLAMAIGCGGGQKQDPAMGGGGGDTAGGGAGGGESTMQAQGSGVPCAQEVALQCGEGMTDGCMTQLTTVHACVPADATAGPPCAQEIALQCPEGQTDACMMTPPPAETHVCVANGHAAAR